MAAFGASFESTSSIEERKEKKRQARREVTEQVRTETRGNDRSMCEPGFGLSGVGYGGSEDQTEGKPTC